MDSLNNSLVQYWNKRAKSYTDVVQKNLCNSWDEKWARLLIAGFPSDTAGLKILDIGTGPGFYAIILAQRGYNVTAIDYSEKMLLEAEKNAGVLSEKIRFMKMDARELLFDNESFDVVVSRNLTWNLTDPEKAYSEWIRVLKKGGVLLNFDANWYGYLVDDKLRAGFENDRLNVRSAGVEDHEAYEESSIMEELSRRLPMTGIKRPEWDLEVLRSLGCKSVSADTAAGDKVWNEEEKLNYASTPGFMVKAVK